MLNGAKVAECRKEVTRCLAVGKQDILGYYHGCKQTWRSRERSRACAAMTERRRDVEAVVTSEASGAGLTRIGFFETVAGVSEMTLLHR
jgi:hypothetical protein